MSCGLPNTDSVQTPECTALVSETGRGMDAAFCAMRAIVGRNAAVFANVETVMANHGVTRAVVGALRIERGPSHEVDFESLREAIAGDIAAAEMMTDGLLSREDYEKFPIYRRAFELAADRIIQRLESAQRGEA